jgi:hypothetical protein
MCKLQSRIRPRSNGPTSLAIGQITAIHDRPGNRADSPQSLGSGPGTIRRIRMVAVAEGAPRTTIGVREPTGVRPPEPRFAVMSGNRWRRTLLVVQVTHEVALVRLEDLVHLRFNSTRRSSAPRAAYPATRSLIRWTSRAFSANSAGGAEHLERACEAGEQRRLRAVG